MLGNILSAKTPIADRRVKQNAQAERGCAGKPYRQRFAAAGVHGAGRRLPMYSAVKSVDDHQSVVVGQYLGWEILGNGKIKDVAKTQILRPFFMGAEINGAGFDFDNDEFAASVQAPPHISTAIVFQGKFRKRAVTISPPTGWHRGPTPGHRLARRVLWSGVSQSSTTQ
jgi:hypothetical protein